MPATEYSFLDSLSSAGNLALGQPDYVFLVRIASALLVCVSLAFGYYVAVSNTAMSVIRRQLQSLLSSHQDQVAKALGEVTKVEALLADERKRSAALTRANEEADAALRHKTQELEAATRREKESREELKEKTAQVGTWLPLCASIRDIHWSAAESRSGEAPQGSLDPRQPRE
jgi:hypothetical protein